MKNSKSLKIFVLISITCTTIFTLGSKVSTIPFSKLPNEEIGSLPEETNKSISEKENTFTENDGKERLFAKYEPVGLKYDKQTRALYFDDKLVRYFEDSYQLYDGNSSKLSFFNELGIIDVYALREPCDSDLSKIVRRADGSFDPGGEIIGINVCSEEEFTARDIEEIKKDEACYTPEKPSRLSVIKDIDNNITKSPYPFDIKKLYSIYEPFGLVYNAEQDCLYYNNQKVRYFFDMMESNGETFSSGNFKGNLREFNCEDGTIDVYTIRDFTNQDEDGHGILLEVKECTEGDFYTRTSNELHFICFNDNYR